MLLNDVIMTSYCCQCYAECLVTTLFQQDIGGVLRCLSTSNVIHVDTDVRVCRAKSQSGRSKRRHRPLYSQDTLTPVPEMTSSRDQYNQHHQQQKKVVNIQTSMLSGAQQHQPVAQPESTPATSSSTAAATAGHRPRGHQRNSVHFDAKVTVVRTSSPPNTTSSGGDSPVLPPPPPPPPPPPLLDEPTRKGRQSGSPATELDGAASKYAREVWPMAPPPPPSSQPGPMLPPPPEFEGGGIVPKQPAGADPATSTPSTTTSGGALPRRNSMLAAMTTDLLGADDASLLAADDYTHIYETPKYLRREKAATLRLGGPGAGRARSAIQYGVLANLDPGAGRPQDGATTVARQQPPAHYHQQQPVRRQQHPQEMPQYARTMPRGIQSAVARRGDGTGLTS